MNFAYWLLGYAVVQVERKEAERVLNVCMLYGVDYADGGSDADFFRICVKSGQAGRLCKLLGQAGVPYAIKRRGGLPQVLHRLCRHPGLVLGVICALCLFVASECFVFDIRVTGNSTLTASEVKALLAEQGFVAGTFIPHVDTDKLEAQVMLASDRIAWMSVNIRGNVANVEIAEQRVPVKKPILRPAHVVAKRSGVIEYVEMYQGNVLVEVGQQVNAGEVLIAGIFDNPTVGMRFTRASGKVMARTVHEFEVFVPYEYEKKEYTGEVFDKKSLIFFTIPIKVFQSTGNWGTLCDKIYIVENCSPVPGAELPIALHTERYLPYRMQTAVRTPEAALTLAHRQLSEQIAQDLQDGELLGKRIYTKIDETGVTLRAVVTCIADIAAVQEFEPEQLNQN